MRTIPHMESHTGSHRLPIIALTVVGAILVLGLIQMSGQTFDDEHAGYEVTLRDGFTN